ncbi:uncharacterized protein BDR25DRAFT_361023 [Lindgomyces ingoldianus]|uniref:Uncharacterized protein n=1 Tax=Lindgomyces ingoldianus TaxID=673940 RepID=A0ACB6QDR2_9PLEO|nr:uncharacterized protein BDR25DRAFT_361023 [Lindgomyces ingoldianus]KAF2465124.1 hypothetical protein BDR25DRAFT_361023 [Lindgomyces ingoldianus]
MNRIGPPSSTLYLANDDGANERPLFAKPETTPFGRSRTISPSSVPTESGLPLPQHAAETATQTYSASALGWLTLTLTYVSSADSFKSNVWIKDLARQYLAKVFGCSRCPSASLPTVSVKEFELHVLPSHRAEGFLCL